MLARPGVPAKKSGGAASTENRGVKAVKSLTGSRYQKYNATLGCFEDVPDPNAPAPERPIVPLSANRRFASQFLANQRLQTQISTTRRGRMEFAANHRRGITYERSNRIRYLVKGEEEKAPVTPRDSIPVSSSLQNIHWVTKPPHHPDSGRLLHSAHHQAAGTTGDDGTRLVLQVEGGADAGAGQQLVLQVPEGMEGQELVLADGEGGEMVLQIPAGEGQQQLILREGDGGRLVLQDSAQQEEETTQLVLQQQQDSQVVLQQEQQGHQFVMQQGQEAQQYVIQQGGQEQHIVLHQGHEKQHYIVQEGDNGQHIVLQQGPETSQHVLHQVQEDGDQNFLQEQEQQELEQAEELTAEEGSQQLILEEEDGSQLVLQVPPGSAGQELVLEEEDGRQIVICVPESGPGGVVRLRVSREDGRVEYLPSAAAQPEHEAQQPAEVIEQAQEPAEMVEQVQQPAEIVETAQQPAEIAEMAQEPAEMAEQAQQPAEVARQRGSPQRPEPQTVSDRAAEATPPDPELPPGDVVEPVTCATSSSDSAAQQATAEYDGGRQPAEPAEGKGGREENTFEVIVLEDGGVVSDDGEGERGVRSDEVAESEPKEKSQVIPVQQVLDSAPPDAVDQVASPPHEVSDVIGSFSPNLRKWTASGKTLQLSRSSELDTQEKTGDVNDHSESVGDNAYSEDGGVQEHDYDAQHRTVHPRTYLKRNITGRQHHDSSDPNTPSINEPPPGDEAPTTATSSNPSTPASAASHPDHHQLLCSVCGEPPTCAGLSPLESARTKSNAPLVTALELCTNQALVVREGDGVCTPCRVLTDQADEPGPLQQSAVDHLRNIVALRNGEILPEAPPESEPASEKVRRSAGEGGGPGPPTRGRRKKRRGRPPGRRRILVPPSNAEVISNEEDVITVENTATAPGQGVISAVDDVTNVGDDVTNAGGDVTSASGGAISAGDPGSEVDVEDAAEDTEGGEAAEEESGFVPPRKGSVAAKLLEDLPGRKIKLPVDEREEDVGLDGTSGKDSVPEAPAGPFLADTKNVEMLLNLQIKVEPEELAVTRTSSGRRSKRPRAWSPDDLTIRTPRARELQSEDSPGKPEVGVKRGRGRPPLSSKRPAIYVTGSPPKRKAMMIRTGKAKPSKVVTEHALNTAKSNDAGRIKTYQKVGDKPQCSDAKASAMKDVLRPSATDGDVEKALSVMMGEDDVADVDVSGGPSSGGDVLIGASQQRTKSVRFAPDVGVKESTRQSTSQRAAQCVDDQTDKAEAGTHPDVTVDEDVETLELSVVDITATGASGETLEMRETLPSLLSGEHMASIGDAESVEVRLAEITGDDAAEADDPSAETLELCVTEGTDGKEAELKVSDPVARQSRTLRSSPLKTRLSALSPAGAPTSRTVAASEGVTRAGEGLEGRAPVVTRAVASAGRPLQPRRGRPPGPRNQAGLIKKYARR